MNLVDMLKARTAAINGMMGAMDDDEMKKVPGVTIAISADKPDGPHPDDENEEEMLARMTPKRARMGY